MMRFVYTFVFCTVLALPIGAQEEAPAAGEVPLEEVKDPVLRKKLLEESVQTLSQGNNTFAAALFSKLKSQQDNLFFSPYSISAAIVMPYAGAIGATKEQIHGVMHYLQNDNNLFEAFSWLNQNLTRSYYEGPNETRLFLANSLWIQRDLRIQPPFTKVMSKYFSAAFRPVDFMRNPEASRFNINDWVRDRTQGRIPTMLGPHDIDKSTRLVVVSAIFMKAVWELAFDPSLTTHGSFFVSNKETASVPFMTRSGTFSIYQAPKYSLLELPYRSTQAGQPDFSMLIVLPSENFGLSDVESTIGSQTIESLLQAVKPAAVVVQIPKFKISSEFNLRNTLQSLGMGLAFSELADFSGINESGSLNINDVIHKAYLQVDEKGSEAIAATAVTIALKSVKNPDEEAIVFRADHPFLFMIVEKKTNAILFMGRLLSPE